MGLNRIRNDSIVALRQRNIDNEAKEEQITKMEETIELLKGCIMELADVVYGEEEIV